MGQVIGFYEAYGWEILGALLVIAVSLLVVQMVRLRKLREQTAQLARQVRESMMYAPLGGKTADDPFRVFTEEEEKQRKQQLEQEMKEKRKEQDQNELISSVLEEIFP